LTIILVLLFLVPAPLFSNIKCDLVPVMWIAKLLFS
jgi:hypothetical protein